MIKLEWHLDHKIVRPLAMRLVDPCHKLGLHPLAVTGFNICLTGLRIVAITYYAYLLGIFLLYFSWLLDEIDGTLARRYNQTTKLGKYMDTGNDTAAYLLIPAVALYLIFSTWSIYTYNLYLVVLGCIVIAVTIIEQQRVIKMDRMGIRIVRDIVLMSIFHTRILI